MADDRIVIEIELDDGSVKKGFLNVEKSAEQSGKSVAGSLDKPRSGLSSLAKGAGIAAAAFVAFKAVTKTIGIFTQGIREAAAEVRAVQELNTALALSGQFSKQTAVEFQAYASSLQEVTTFGNDAVLSTAALIQNLGKLKPDELQRSTKAALDLATALKIDVQSAATLVGKAATGEISSFSRYGIIVKKTGDAAKDFGNILNKLEKDFGGASEAAAKTSEGGLKQARNNFGDMLEELGKLVTQSPAIASTLNMLSKGFARIGLMIKESFANKDIFKDMIINFSIIAQAGIESARRIGISFELAALRAQQAWLAFKVLTTAGLSETFNQQLQDVLDKIEEVKMSATEDSGLTKWFGELIDKVSETNGQLTDMNDQGIANVNRGLEDGVAKVGKYRDAIVNGLGQAASGAIQNLVKQLAKGKLSLQDFGNFILSAMGDIAIQVGTMMVTTGIGMLALKALDPSGSIAAGAGLIAIGTIMKAIGGSESGVDVAKGAGGVPTSPAFQDDAILPEDIEEQKPVTQVAINIQGDVLDSRDSGMRIVDLIKEYTDRNGRTEVLA